VPPASSGSRQLYVGAEIEQGVQRINISSELAAQ
jgi:hypothetical protein